MATTKNTKGPTGVGKARTGGKHPSAARPDNQHQRPSEPNVPRRKAGSLTGSHVPRTRKSPSEVNVK